MSAKAWVEKTCPWAQGTTKAGLILAYGAGYDAAMREIEEVIEQAPEAVAGRVGQDWGHSPVRHEGSGEGQGQRS